MKIKPFDQFELMKMYGGEMPVVCTSDYGCLYNTNLPKQKLKHYTYTYMIDNNLDLIKAYPDDNNNLFLYRFNVCQAIKISNLDICDKKLLYPKLQTLAKRFERDVNKLAYKFIKQCRDKEYVLECWEWEGPTQSNFPIRCSL